MSIILYSYNPKILILFLNLVIKPLINFFEFSIDSLVNLPAK
jgi:hypothetical protein